MVSLLLAEASLLVFNALAMDVIIRNEIPTRVESSCPTCQTSVFVPDFDVKVWGPGQVVVPRGLEVLLTNVDMGMGGVGVQVNGFFFAYDKQTRALAEQLSIDPNNHQTLNPDNSGAQVYLNTDCSFMRASAPWSGIGVPTYAIADLSSQRDGNTCKITVRANDDTYRLSTFEGRTYRGFNSGTGGLLDGVPAADQNKVAAGCFLDVDSYKASWGAIDFQPNTFAVGSTHGNVEAPTYSCSNRGSGNVCSENGTVWNALAEGHTCGSRIAWVRANIVAGDLQAAKAQVAMEYPSACGACARASETTTTSTTSSLSGDLCAEVWHSDAEGFTCGSRISWVHQHLVPGDWEAAKTRVASEYPSICGACAPAVTRTTTNIADLCAEVWNSDAEGFTCGSRISWVQLNLMPGDWEGAKARVASEYPSSCGACAPTRRLAALRGIKR